MRATKNLPWFLHHGRSLLFALKNQRFLFPLGSIVLFIQIVGIFIAYQAATPVTCCIEISITATAKGETAVAFVIFGVDPPTAAVTGCGYVIQTIFAVIFFVKDVLFTGHQNTATANTGMVAHIYILP